MVRFNFTTDRAYALRLATGTCSVFEPSATIISGSSAPAAVRSFASPIRVECPLIRNGERVKVNIPSDPPECPRDSPSRHSPPAGLKAICPNAPSSAVSCAQLPSIAVRPVLIEPVGNPCRAVFSVLG